VLTKRLRRISRAGGGYHPQFVGDDPDARRLAARVLGVFQGHVGEPRRALDDSLERLERDAEGFKLVRGFAKLLERETRFETRAPLPPERVRRSVFEAAETVGVASADERARALADAADALGTDTQAVEASLYADRESAQVVASVDADCTPAELCARYDFALAAAALLDATTIRLRASDPAALVSAVKREGLLYEVVETDGEGSDDETDDTSEATLSTREVVVTGPDALFRRTRRYGVAFANLLRTVARTAPRWELTATVDDRGTDRTLQLSDADVPVPDAPTGEPAFDSGVEASFAARFRALDLDWTLVREPEPLVVDPAAAAADPEVDDTDPETNAPDPETNAPDPETNAPDRSMDAVDAPRVAIPDFAFDYDHADFRLFFEVMGFWTPAYVEKKLAQLRGLEDVALLVAVDESLGVGEDVAATGSDVIGYDGTVRVKDVVDVLREYESELAAAATADLPAELAPEADSVAVADLAAEYGVPVEALDDVQFPDHERVGDTLVRPAVLERVAADLSAGDSFESASERLAAAGIDDASAALSRLGYRVAWEGLGGGALEEL
jgi:predicted nuclease of restriction endonuclease-like RecB superfamily